MRNLLAFDLGTSNGRTILGRFDGERITMQELHRSVQPHHQGLGLGDH